MRSPPRVPHKFSGPWQLFVWTLRGQPGLLAGLGLALLGVLACEVTVPRLLAEAIDAALVAKDAVRLDVAGMAIIAVVVALYFVHVLYIGLETRLLYAAMLRLAGCFAAEFSSSRSISSPRQRPVRSRTPW